MTPEKFRDSRETGPNKVFSVGRMMSNDGRRRPAAASQKKAGKLARRAHANI